MKWLIFRINQQESLTENKWGKMDTKIYLLSRCVERKYAELMFYKGILHFSQPAKWIEEAKKGNVGQGDLLEGVYSNEINAKTLGIRDNADTQVLKSQKYLRSCSVVKDWLCLCFYSACDLTDHHQEGDTLVFDMSKAYAEDFGKDETWESRFDKGLKERKSMVVIHRPDIFINKIKSFFEENGLVEGCDYYMQSIHYRAEGERFTYEKAPLELLHKDARFVYQQEFRIMLNSASRKVQKILINGQDVSIGSSLEDCAMLKSHFYTGARILVKGDAVRLEVDDWSNMAGTMHELEVDPLLYILAIASVGDVKGILDGREVGRLGLRMETINVLKAKYRILFNPGIVFSWDSLEKIRKNEGVYSYYYVGKYSSYEAPTFNGLWVRKDDGYKKYTDLLLELDEPLVVPRVKQ